MNNYFVFSTFVWLGCLNIGPAFSKNEGETWAVLITGPGFYKYTYGMEGAVYKMYDTLTRGGIPKDNIIVISANIIAYHQSNVNIGAVTYMTNDSNVFSSPNYYDNVVVDYSANLTPQQFFDILQGNKTNDDLKKVGSGKLIQSGPKDKILVYYEGFNIFGGLLFSSKYVLYPEVLIPFLEKMKEDKKFDKMLWIVQSNAPGFLFDDYLDPDKHILVYALGGRYNDLSLCHYNSMLNAYTSICSSSAFHRYLNKMLASNGGKETIFDTFVNERYADWEDYETVRNLYGEISMAKEEIRHYLGNSHKAANVEIDLDSLRQEASSLSRIPLRETMLNDDILLAPEKRKHLLRTVRNIVESSIEGTDIAIETVLKRKLGELSKEHTKCATAAVQAAESKCFESEWYSAIKQKTDLKRENLQPQPPFFLHLITER